MFYIFIKRWKRGKKQWIEWIGPFFLMEVGFCKADSIHLVEASFSPSVFMIQKAEALVASMSINLSSLDDHSGSKSPSLGRDHKEITVLIQSK